MQLGIDKPFDQSEVSVSLTLRERVMAVDALLVIAGLGRSGEKSDGGVNTQEASIDKSPVAEAQRRQDDSRRRVNATNALVALGRLHDVSLPPSCKKNQPSVASDRPQAARPSEAQLPEQ